LLITPVILCGGAGTRLWPASRPDMPKPFLPLVAGRSTFALTLARIADPALFASPVVVAGAGHQHLVTTALSEVGIAASVLLEPGPRDTAAAISAAATLVAASDPDATLLVLPADHVVRDIEGFAATVAAAVPAADNGRIVTFGVKPDRPATEYGYVEPGPTIEGMPARFVERFVEKPDEDKAVALVAAGCLWNSGIFLMRVATAMAEMTRHAPRVASAAQNAVRGVTADGAGQLVDEVLLSAPKISFDYAVMEKTDLAAVVEARFDWSDLGTWSAVWDAAGKDADGNVAEGDATLVDTRGAYVATSRPKLGVVGLDDVVIVASDDAVLVTNRANADSVKTLVAAIDSAPEAVIGDFVRHYRPWGHYQSLELGTGHQVKRIVVNAGQRLSLQKHAHRAEHWTVVEGVAEVTVGMTMETLAVTTVDTGTSIDVPRGAIHRLTNRGAVPVTVIEVQFGDYLGEDDIVRLQDDYGRGE
jgi:mannose-1-phosphate guanylyltransferase/mannose-6-phosphate isomerase